MTIKFSKEGARNYLREEDEIKRLSKLSGEDLVKEYLQSRGFEDDLVGEELCRRVWPEWEVAEL